MKQTSKKFKLNLLEVSLGSIVILKDYVICDIKSPLLVSFMEDSSFIFS